MFKNVVYGKTASGIKISDYLVCSDIKYLYSFFIRTGHVCVNRRTKRPFRLNTDPGAQMDLALQLERLRSLIWRTTMTEVPVTKFLFWRLHRKHLDKKSLGKQKQFFRLYVKLNNPLVLLLPVGWCTCRAAVAQEVEQWSKGQRFNTHSPQLTVTVSLGKTLLRLYHHQVYSTWVNE